MIYKNKRERVYLSLGSNCANAPFKLQQALQALANIPGAQVNAISPLFQTEPQDFRQQNWFFNQCVRLDLEKSWTAENFLVELLRLESSLGRERQKGVRFGPRAIDLDLLIFEGRQSADPFCHLPHPRMHRRAFVLLPLYIIEPCLILHGQSLPHWLSLLAWKVEGNRIWQS